MTVDEMELLERLREVPAVPAAVSERAYVVLQAAMVVATTEPASPRRSLRGRGRRRPVPETGRRHHPVAVALTGVAAAGRWPAQGRRATCCTGWRLPRLPPRPPRGGYLVLAEVDTETGYPGQFHRTTVVDTLTGASRWARR